MTSLEHIQQLMAELGPAMEDVAAVGQDPDGSSWAIELDDETIVSIEFDADREKLALSISLPKPPADRRSDVYEALLTYNMLWQDASALRMAMDKPGGELLQVTEAPTASLDLAALQTVLRDFVRKAALWREAIVSGCILPSEGVADGEMGAAAIRV